MLKPMTPDKIIAQYPPEIAATASALRKFLLTHLKGIVEQPDAAANVIGYSYGTGYKDLICTLMLSKTGTKLGFYKGQSCPTRKSSSPAPGKFTASSLSTTKATSDARPYCNYFRSQLRHTRNAWVEL